jgi:hypothetical protein
VLVGWLAEPAVLFSHIISTPAINHQSATSIFLSQQISTSHQLAEQGISLLFTCTASPYATKILYLNVRAAKGCLAP